MGRHAGDRRRHCPPVQRRTLRCRVARAGRLLRSRLAWSGRQRPLLRRLPHGHGSVPAVAGGSARRDSSSCNGGAMESAAPTIRCSGRSTPTISAPTASRPRDFSNLRQNGLIRVVFPLPPNIKLIDPATNAPSGETIGRRLAHGAGRNDVKLTGPDGVNPVAARTESDRRVSAGWPFVTLQEQALGALLNHAQIQQPAAAATARRPGSFQRVLFTNDRVRRSLPRSMPGVTPLPDPDPRLNALEQQGKVVFERACAHCHGGPGQSTAQLPVVRMHDIFTQCPRPVDTRRRPPRFNFAPCPPRLARNARTYEITRPNGTTLRRTSSDPGRALLTGVVGAPYRRPDDWNKFDVPGLRGICAHRAVLPQQQRRHAGRGRRSLHRVLQARAGRLRRPASCRRWRRRTA